MKFRRNLLLEGVHTDRNIEFFSDEMAVVEEPANTELEHPAVFWFHFKGADQFLGFEQALMNL